MVHHVGQGGKAPVVHVGRRQGNVAQRGYPELAVVGGPPGHRPQAQIGRHGIQAVVAEGVVGLQVATVAVAAVAAAQPPVGVGREQNQPLLLVGTQRRAVAPPKPVVARVARNQRALKLRQGLQRVFLRNGAAAKRLAEQGGILSQLLQPGHARRQRLVHFHRVFHGLAGLRFQAAKCPVPGQLGLPGQVIQRHGAARRYPLVHAQRKGPPVGKGQLLPVAGGTGHRAVQRERRFVKQPPAQGHALHRDGVVGRGRRGGRKIARHHQVVGRRRHHGPFRVHGVDFVLAAAGQRQQDAQPPQLLACAHRRFNWSGRARW